MKALIIDDEEHCRENLAVLLERKCPEITETEPASSVLEAFDKIKLSKPEILFLDIEMPEKNGFELLKMIDLSHHQIIFVTAYDHYALKAIQFSPAAYLLKPIDIDKLTAAVEKTIEQIRSKLTIQDEYKKAMLHLAHLVAEKSPPDRICLADTSKLQMVKLDDIVLLSSDNYYTTFYLSDGSKKVISKTLKTYQNMLGSQFIRPHRSYLVNKLHIVEYSFKNNVITLSNKMTVPVSRRKVAEIIEYLKLNSR